MSRFTLPRSRFWLTAWLWACLALPAVAADPTADLLHFVNPDAAICLEVSDFETLRPRILASGLWQRLSRSELYREWTSSPEYGTFQNQLAQVEAAVGQPLDPLLLSLSGKSLVVAVYVPQQGKLPHVVILARGSGAASVKEGMALLDRLDPRPAQQVAHQGIPYTARGVDQGGPALCYGQLDDVLVISDEPATMNQTLDLVAQRRSIPARPAGLLANDEFAALREALATSEGKVYIRPRALDAVMKLDRLRNGDQNEKFTAEAWSRLGYIGLGLAWDEKAPRLETVFRLEPGAADAAWRSFTAATAGPATFAGLIPPQALLAGAGRFDFGWLGREIDARVPKGADRKFDSTRRIARGLMLGQDPLTDVLPACGADYGYFVIPRTKLALDAPPVHGLFAVRIGAPGAEAHNSKVPAALENALTTALNLLSASINEKGEGEESATVQVEMRGGTKVVWVEGAGPHRAAFALTPEWLFVASDPDCIDLCLQAKPAEAQPAAASQQLVFNAKASREFLQQQRGALVDQLSQTRGLNAVTADAKLQRLLDVLLLIDGLTLTADLTERQVRLVLTGASPE